MKFSPVHTLQHHSGSPSRHTDTLVWERVERLWKYEGGSTVNRLWLQDFVTFMGETQQHKNPAIFRHLHIKGPEEIYCHGSLSTPVEKKKKKNFPLMSGHSQPRGILRISEALFFPPSCVFGQHGSDNILAQEQNCNIRQVSGQSLTLFSHWLR